MTKENDILYFFDQILVLFENYQSGDLVVISEIIQIFEESEKLINEEPIFKNYPDIVKLINKNLKAMTKNQNYEKNVIATITNIIKLIKDYFNKNIEKNIFNNKLTDNINDLKKNLDDKIDSISYDNIVDDPKLLNQFYDEATEHLNQAQFTLIDLEYDPNNQELINNIFRNFHTIKGSSSFLGLKNIENVSHKLEDLFDLVRKNKILISKDLIDVIFYGMNIIRTILDAMEVNHFKKEDLKKSFELINIFDYIELMNKILKEYSIRKIGEILLDFGKINLKQLQYVLKKQNEMPEKKLGEIFVEEKIVNNDDINLAIKKQDELKSKIAKTGYVKVSNERLNTLIDIVGELVTHQSMLKQEIIQNNIRIQNIERSLTDFENITTTIKNIVLSMGMSPIEEIFNKLKIVARNTANELGKSIYVEIEGGETEIDRNVMEKIYDPLIHIVRNAIDHGIESPEEREKAGKNKTGKIILKADHKGSGIEISVIDDGNGIDKSKIIEKAMKLKLLDNKDNLSEKEIYNILFLPGFSTSENVTKVSGRGVGLDVVKKNLDLIRGKVEIQSELKKGTSFTIRLPLSLAIIDGFVMKVESNKYVLPFNLIEEILVLEKENLLFNNDNKSAMIYHRGIHIPVIFLQKNLEKSFEEKRNNYISIIINFNQEKYCIIVDEIIGKQEIVIKNLSDLLNENKCFSGGTIFGDGSIGFVLDMQGLIDTMNKEQEKIVK